MIYSSAVWGPSLGPEFGRDFQSTFFEDWLRWTGIDDIITIRFHPTLNGDAETGRRQAHHHASEAARQF